MSLQATENRKDYLFDFSRWNRAGLTRFEYVDGDAAVWLEELRIAMLGLSLRGADLEDRVPEKWRDLFMKPISEHQLSASETELESDAVWKDVFTTFPKDTETGGIRNERLLEQYHRESPDYAWETMRAFARAAHILLGHLDAYTNEGYLRTATQWENLRKLAAMVNYQPTPPASATTTVALEIEEDKGVIEIAKGLTMKYAPPEGGAPLIFETLKPVFVHPDLDAAQTKGWKYNRESLDLSNGWIVPEKAKLAQGDLVVLTSGSNGIARSLTKIERDEEAEKATLEFNSPLDAGITAKTGDILLLTEPDDVRLGLPVSTANRVVIKVNNADAYAVGAVVEVTYGSNVVQAVVVDGANGYLTLNASEAAANGMATVVGSVTIEAFTPYTAGDSGVLQTPKSVSGLYYRSTAGSGEPVMFEDHDDTRTAGGVLFAYTHKPPTTTGSGLGYARLAGSKVDNGDVVGLPPITGATKKNTVRFEGSPPVSLNQGDWYVAREVGTSVLNALEVVTVREEADVYFIKFAPAPTSDPDETEFFGPMTRTLRPVDFDRDQRDAINGGVARLIELSTEATELVKVGRDVIVVHEKDEKRKATNAVLESVEDTGELLKITMKTELDVTGWEAGWTRFYLNTVDISHGETKDPKVLGSGDAEKKRQDFQFKISDVSFIPSNAAVTGVSPDMDVTVDGVKWEFRDYGDPLAEDKDAWSVVLNEDDTLQIYFRRRLPSGTNNIAVSRHRVGVGARGTGVPAWSMTKPMKKNRFVSGVVQPIATAGGAAREPVSDIRDNAPSKLAANGRAVSLKDFELLCKRHSSVWQAKSRIVVALGSTGQVNIVIVPANGGQLTPTLESDLIDFVRSRALPNTTVTLTPYETLPVRMHVSVNVDTDRYVKSDVKDAVEAGLVAEFALQDRKLSQPLYVAEIFAAVERVVGVSSVTIKEFSLRPGAPAPLREAEISGSLVAIYPTEEQVAVVTGIADVIVDVEALS